MKSFKTLLCVLITAAILCGCSSNSSVNVGDKVSASFNGTSVTWIKNDSVEAASMSDDMQCAVTMSTDEGRYAVIIIENNVTGNTVPVEFAGHTYQGGYDLKDGYGFLNLILQEDIAMSVQIGAEDDPDIANARVTVTSGDDTLEFSMQDALDTWYELYNYGREE